MQPSSRWVLPLLCGPLAGALAACGETTFTVVGVDGGADVSASDAKPNGDAKADRASVDGTVADVGAKDSAVDAGSPCASPSATNTVSVSPTGTWKTVLDGVSQATKLGVSMAYVCVAGGTYAETNLVIPPGITVIGYEGASLTTIAETSKTPCAQNGPCALQMRRGSAIDGFTIAAPAGSDGIVALVGVDVVDRARPAPSVRNVVVTGFTANGPPSTTPVGGSGIVALSDLDVGPGVTADHNVTGLLSSATAPATVHVHGSTNEFNSNTAHGIDLVGAASLDFEGGSTSSNANCGIRLGGTPASTVDAGAAPLQHTITGLTATGNADVGVAVYNGTGALVQVQYLTVRSSTILAADVPDAGPSIGLYYDYAFAAATNMTPGPLDLGTDASRGDNTFGIALGGVGHVTRGAGLVLCQTTQGMLPVNGDKFSHCDPIETQTGCSAPAVYADVAYQASGVSGAPVVAANCLAGE